MRVSERTAALMKTQDELTHLSRVLSMGKLMASIVHENQAAAYCCGRPWRRMPEWLSAEPPNLDKARQISSRGKTKLDDFPQEKVRI